MAPDFLLRLTHCLRCSVASVLETPASQHNIKEKGTKVPNVAGIFHDAAPTTFRSRYFLVRGFTDKTTSRNDNGFKARAV